MFSDTPLGDHVCWQ